MSHSPLLHWKVDECAAYFDRLLLRGWAYHMQQAIEAVEVQFDGSLERFSLSSYGQPSSDVAAAIDPGACSARFDEWLLAPVDLIGRPFVLHFRLNDGSSLIGADALTNCATGDPYFQIWEDFIAMLGTYSSGTVLELGARARSGITRRHRVPPQLTYLGLDIRPGPNVDVVGDAHDLSAVLAGRKFVAVFSASVFEHLAMPWKVVLELNRVLEPNGLVYTASHQTWPVHEEPWDFWRFTRHSWRTLFNPATGFRVLNAVVGEPARVHACRSCPVTRDLPSSPAYLGSSCIARKVAETSIVWPVDTRDATESFYPAAELTVPPTSDRT